MRYPKRPLLPGSSVTTNIGQTRFHKSHHLEFVTKGVPYISEKQRPGIGGQPVPGTESACKPSAYALGEVVKLPPWLVFDKHVLAFDCYYLEPTEVSTAYNIVVHRCMLYFFLEDGTIKVVEQKTANTVTGCIISRQRIRYPSEGANDYFDILDFNIGNNVELHGKIFKLTDCDEFTRKFLNRLGICVPDRIATPEDPYTKQYKERQEKACKQPRLNKRMTLEDYLSDDNRKLNFMAYWDDRESDNGFVHLLAVSYFLLDDTIEITDITDKERPFLILKRSKLPMDVHYKYEGPGAHENRTILNCIASGPSQKLRFVYDPLDMGADRRPTYKDRDIRLGSIISAFGRKIVVYDCDNFTKEFYKNKYGIERFDPIDRPLTKEEELAKQEVKLDFKTPPYNGFGTYEDSLINCKRLHIQTEVKPYTQFLEKDRKGYDGMVLRFLCRSMIKNQLTDRYYVISYYLKDDEITVFEMESKTSSKGSIFISKRPLLKPGEKLILDKPPKIYTSQDLYIGNNVCFDEFHFNIIGSDEYSLRYMETHPNEYPKSNIHVILNKVKENVKPVFKSFVATFLEGQEFPPAPYEQFSNALKSVMGDQITEHEILTMARFYGVVHEKEQINLETLRQLTHDELRKKIYNDFDRLRECFQHFDPERCGFVTKEKTYTILRGCKIPLDVEHIRVILEKFGRGEKCDIVYDELIRFLNYICDPQSKHIQPLNISSSMAWLQMCKPLERSKVAYVNVDRLIKDLDFEKDLKNECK